MIKIENIVECYEVDGKKISSLELPCIKIKNHWNDNRLIVLEVCGNSYAILAKDLFAAIDNATNTAKF